MMKKRMVVEKTDTSQPTAHHNDIEQRRRTLRTSLFWMGNPSRKRLSASLLTRLPLPEAISLACAGGTKNECVAMGGDQSVAVRKAPARQCWRTIQLFLLFFVACRLVVFVVRSDGDTD